MAAQIEYPLDTITSVSTEALDHVRPDFGPAVKGHHRVDDNCPVEMKTDPVVGENGIRRLGFRQIRLYDDCDAGSPKRIHEALKLCGGGALLQLRVHDSGVSLKLV
jgi:hypothetical protein